jgi:hypothetical protein
MDSAVSESATLTRWNLPAAVSAALAAEPAYFFDRSSVISREGLRVARPRPWSRCPAAQTASEPFCAFASAS